MQIQDNVRNNQFWCGSRSIVERFLLRDLFAQTVYTVCTRKNYKIVPVTNLNKYLHYGTMELTNM